MKTKSFIPRLAGAAALALASMPHAARACDICMGGPATRPAVNWAIFFMLGVVALMATGVGFFIRYLARRARLPMPAYEEFLR